MTTNILVHKTDEYTLVISYEGEPIDELTSVDIRFNPVPLFSSSVHRRGETLTDEELVAEDFQPYTRLESA